MLVISGKTFNREENGPTTTSSGFNCSKITDLPFYDKIKKVTFCAHVQSLSRAKR